MKTVSSMLVLIGVLTACGEGPESRAPVEASAQEADEDAGKPSVLSTTPYDRPQREEYEARVQAILNLYVERWERLRVAAHGAGPKTMETMGPVLARLEATISTVGKILSSVRAADFESWKDRKPEIHAALDALELSYDRAATDLQDLTGDRYVLDGTMDLGEASQNLAAGRR
jgi:hypothetical protein